MVGELARPAEHYKLSVFEIRAIVGARSRQGVSRISAFVQSVHHHSAEFTSGIGLAGRNIAMNTEKWCKSTDINRSRRNADSDFTTVPVCRQYRIGHSNSFR
jgi:hypothetical protein